MGGVGARSKIFLARNFFSCGVFCVCFRVLKGFFFESFFCFRFVFVCLLMFDVAWMNKCWSCCGGAYGGVACGVVGAGGGGVAGVG